MKWFYDYDAFDGALHPQAWLTPVVEETMGILWVYRRDLFSPPGPRPYGFKDEDGALVEASTMWDMICDHDNVNVDGEDGTAIGADQWRPRLTFRRFRGQRKESSSDRAQAEELLP